MAKAVSVSQLAGYRSVRDRPHFGTGPGPALALM